MNTIDIVEHLKEVPASRSRSIAVAAINLINAGILANDSQEAAAEAKRIYSRSNGGMWKKYSVNLGFYLKRRQNMGSPSKSPTLLKTVWFIVQQVQGLPHIFGL